jgi:hypothetical protein
MAIVPYSGQVSYNDIRSQFGSPSNFNLQSASNGTYGGFNAYSYIQPTDPGGANYSPNQWYGYVGDYIYSPNLITAWDAWPTIGSYPGFGTSIIDVSGDFPPHDGNLYAGTTWSPLNGGYWVFDGTDDRIASIGGQTYYSFTNQISVDFWVKWDVNTFINWGQGCGQGEIYNYDAPNANMWLMHGNQGNTVSWYVFNGPNASINGGTTPVLTMGQWYNITGTMNAGGSSMYLNGTLVGTGGGLGGGNMISNPNAVVYLGGDVRYDFRFMNGAIAAIHIYNTALTAGQVSQNFNALRGRFGI